MKSKLSPQGRKLVLTGSRQNVRAVVQVRRGLARAALQTLLEELGGRVLSAGEGTDIATIEIPAHQLDALAASRAVDYVEIGGRMAPNAAD